MPEEEKTQAEEIEEELKARDAKKKADEAKEEGKDSKEEKAGEAKAGEEIEVKKKDKDRKERTGVLYVNTTSNNTILTVTDIAGNTIARSSGGQSTKQSRLKSSQTVAMFAAKKIGEEAKDAGLTQLYIRVKARTGSPTTGGASHAIIKSLTREGLKVFSIMDITRQPRGGPKAKGGRRGRRV